MAPHSCPSKAAVPPAGEAVGGGQAPVPQGEGHGLQGHRQPGVEPRCRPHHTGTQRYEPWPLVIFALFLTVTARYCIAFFFFFFFF